MLIFLSDLHLRPGAASRISRAGQFARFWKRVEGIPRDTPARLCFVGDLFDLVRAPDWLAMRVKPYHPPSAELSAAVLSLVERTIAAEQPFLDAIRARADEGALAISYVVGNHDRLLHHVPAARAAVRRALGMPGGDAPLPSSMVFPEEGVLAYHGHTVDTLCHDPSGAAPLSDMVAAELIIRFPSEIRRSLQIDHPHLDDIDDVRPVLAVPTWVRSLAQSEAPHLGKGVARVWRGLVESFLENPHVREWMRDNHRPLKLDFAQRFKLLLALSAKMSPRDEPRLTQLYYLLFKLIDVRFARTAVKMLEQKEHRGLRYVVNGHTHFAGMTPLGNVNGQSACYFNTGTWRTLHQLGNVARGKPSFLAFDAMAYLVFFGNDDPLSREFEWWQGAAG